MKKLVYSLLLAMVILFSSCDSKMKIEEPISQSNPHIASAEDVKVGMGIGQVLEALGQPDRDVGSGLPIHEYDLPDGSVAIIGYQMHHEYEFIVTHVYIGPPKE